MRCRESTNQCLVLILKQGVERWNRCRQDHREVVPELLGADVHKANLILANFRNPDLRGAELSDADLNWADLSIAMVATRNSSPALRKSQRSVLQPGQPAPGGLWRGGFSVDGSVFGRPLEK